MADKIRKGRPNVFDDLGFQAGDADNLRIRATLMAALSQLITERELTQQEAADLFGVTQPRVSDVVRGKIDRFSIDTLVNMLSAADLHVDVHVERASA